MVVEFRGGATSVGRNRGDGLESTQCIVIGLVANVYVTSASRLGRTRFFGPLI
jgi:hypothetical protein